MGKSKIEWTDKVWNPVTGCTPISPGCKNCYAERMAARLKAMGQEKYKDGFAVRTHENYLYEPTRWKNPCRVFVCSMGDLFHDQVPTTFIEEVFLRMELYAPQHTYIVLTKRAERMAAYFSQAFSIAPSDNIHIGVSIENQKLAKERIPYLFATPAANRFVSIEPMLGPVDLTSIDTGGAFYYPLSGGRGKRVPYEKLNGVILGCESGPGARPMKDDWARKVRNDCAAVGVPFFLKQMKVDGKLVKMPYLDGLQHKELP